jgi:hypothetical protein
MVDERYRTRLAGLNQPCGADVRDLHVGPWVVRLEGLSGAAARTLDERWGPFIGPPGGDRATQVIRLADAGTDAWLPGPVRKGERYRMEVAGREGERLVVSYNFAIGRAMGEDLDWLLAVTRGAGEPVGRLIENAVRFVLAVLALDAGGFALHSAGVLLDGRAWIFAGPSRSGKSTAVASSAPARSLGDDFGLVYPDAGTWWAPAVPFDGSERVAGDVPRGRYPVAAIWRLFQTQAVEIDHPPASVASASLLSCVAFPWAYPDSAGDLLDHVRRFVEESCFGHLGFALNSNLYAEVLDRR